jgi:hypothetical protein
MNKEENQEFVKILNLMLLRLISLRSKDYLKLYNTYLCDILINIHSQNNIHNKECYYYLKLLRIELRNSKLIENSFYRGGVILYWVTDCLLDKPVQEQVKEILEEKIIFIQSLILKYTENEQSKQDTNSITTIIK